MKIEVVEYLDDGWYLTIGNKAPWDNLHIRVSKFIAKWFIKKPSRQYCLPDNVTNRKENVQYILDVHGITVKEIAEELMIDAYKAGWWDRGLEGYVSMPNAYVKQALKK